MLATLLCAALTVIGFIMGQVSEGKWKWDDNVEMEFTSAFLTGVYGMWNIYIFALIILYAPSHKKWAADSTSGKWEIDDRDVRAAPTGLGFWNFCRANLGRVSET